MLVPPYNSFKTNTKRWLGVSLEWVSGFNEKSTSRILDKVCRSFAAAMGMERHIAYSQPDGEYREGVYYLRDAHTGHAYQANVSNRKTESLSGYYQLLWPLSHLMVSRVLIPVFDRTDIGRLARYASGLVRLMDLPAGLDAPECLSKQALELFFSGELTKVPSSYREGPDNIPDISLAVRQESGMHMFSICSGEGKGRGVRRASGAIGVSGLGWHGVKFPSAAGVAEQLRDIAKLADFPLAYGPPDQWTDEVRNSVAMHRLAGDER